MPCLYNCIREEGKGKHGKEGKEEIGSEKIE